MGMIHDIREHLTELSVRFAEDQKFRRERYSNIKGKAPDGITLKIKESIRTIRHALRIRLQNPPLSVDYSKDELWEAMVNRQAAWPAQPKVGALVFRGDTDGFYCWDGTQWYMFATYYQLTAGGSSTS